MRIRIFILATLAIGSAAPARAGVNISNFEDSGLASANSYFNAAPNLTDPSYARTTSLKGQFVSGGNSFSSSYQYVVDPKYGNYSTWSGWSISNQSNVSYVNQIKTPDYGFEYTSVTGSGANGSSTYAVANTEGSGQPPVSIVNLAPGSAPVSVQVTNTAYDYFSMVYGDSFATPYERDNYLRLTIDGYSGADGTGTNLGEIPIYLANFLGQDPSQYYIVTNWLNINLSNLQGARSLVFGLQSNKMNDFGIATPFEFALDDLVTVTPGVVPEPSSLLLCLGGIAMSSLVRRVRPRNRPL